MSHFCDVPTFRIWISDFEVSFPELLFGLILFRCGTSGNYPRVEDNFQCFFSGYWLKFTLEMRESCPTVISCACTLFELSST